MSVYFVNSSQLILLNVLFLVSMGGTVGLFLGGSLLSIVEFVYYFVIRQKAVFIKKKNEISQREVNFNQEIIKSLAAQRNKSKTVQVKPAFMSIPYFP